MRAKAEVETVSSSGGGEEARRAGLSNNKGHRGKVRQVNLLLPVVVSVNLGGSPTNYSSSRRLVG